MKLANFKFSMIFSNMLKTCKLLLRNVSFLLTKSLEKQHKPTYLDTLDELIELLKYEIPCTKTECPKIKTAEETIHDLIAGKASFCRFGDGEFAIINGDSIPFQEFNFSLSERLKEILMSQQARIYIGIPHAYFAPTSNFQDIPKHFLRTWCKDNRNKILGLIDLNKTYYDTGCSQMYTLWKEYNFLQYFEFVKKIWEDRDIAIISGKTVFDKIATNIFACARSVEYQIAPSMNAYDEYKTILLSAKKIRASKLIIIILGPTATVLAYDLAIAGYQAIDFGHIAKDYDCFSKKLEHTDQSIIDFFSPD